MELCAYESVPLRELRLHGPNLPVSPMDHQISCLRRKNTPTCEFSGLFWPIFGEGFRNIKRIFVPDESAILNSILRVLTQ